MAEDLAAKVSGAEEMANTNQSEAIKYLKDAILGNYPNDPEAIKLKERALVSLAGLLVKQGDAVALRTILSEMRPLFASIPKAKTAKIVRTVIDSIAKVPGSNQLLLEVCREQVAWAASEKRTFLRQRIEVRLASLYSESNDYPAALALIGKLLTEVKRLDDKLLLVDIHLLESKVHHALKNLPKSKAALTAARTAANAIYVPPSLQAEIDTQSGILHGEENDHKTAYSYYFEAFEAYSALDDPKAVFLLKYMLLSKIMTGDAHEVPAIASSKGGLKHAGSGVDAMREVAAAYAERSLAHFQQAVDSHKKELQEDPIVHSHLATLYDTMLQQNLLRLLEPFSRVEISHVAELVGLASNVVETKLGQMILDKKFAGTLHAGVGVLEVFDAPVSDPVFPAALETIESLGRVVDSLYGRTTKIST
jgi:26S proteasome regulatory subunit N6